MPRGRDDAGPTPYLFFDGRCEEAIAFSTRALGAEVTMLMRFEDSPEPQAPGTIPPGRRQGDGCEPAPRRHGAVPIRRRVPGAATFEGFALSLNAPDEAAAERLFASPAEGGEVRMALARTRFGMVAEGFGVPWMVHVAA